MRGLPVVKFSNAQNKDLVHGVKVQNWITFGFGDAMGSKSEVSQVQL